MTLNLPSLVDLVLHLEKTKKKHKTYIIHQIIKECTNDSLLDFVLSAVNGFFKIDFYENLKKKDKSTHHSKLDPR